MNPLHVIAFNILTLIGIIAPPTKEPAAAIAPEDLSDAENEEVDENDPLYQATLRITNGNKQAAIKMLNDPDSLMQYPEIRAIIESQSAEDDIDVIVETVSEPVASLPTTAPDLPPAAAARTPSAPEEDEVGGESEEKAVVSDGDPREHLNIVFIGHVGMCMEFVEESNFQLCRCRKIYFIRKYFIFNRQC